MKLVSIIIPVYNEEKYIGRCIESLINQTYPLSCMEIIVVDGGSKDNTREIVNSLNCSSVKMIDNPKRLVTYALNLGIDSAKGDYIIRIDAHAKYANNYVERCVYYLENMDIENVGGVAETVGEGFVGKGNAEILSSPFGVGNSRFRLNSKSGYVDTVPFGAFRREIFKKIGYFNPDFPRSEDNDFNSRIRKSGGKIFLADDIHFVYYCRNTILGLLDQGLKNGNALFLTIRKNPSAMSLRHYIPFCFTLSILVLPFLGLFYPFFMWLFLVEMMLYGSLDVFFSFLRGSAKYGLYKFFMYPIFHICYGVGSFIGALGIKVY